MAKRLEIKEKLKKGDIRDIADATGFTPEYVNMVLNGTRNNDEIVRIANIIHENRSNLQVQIQNAS